jgi:hypothetical protein
VTAKERFPDDRSAIEVFVNDQSTSSERIEVAVAPFLIRLFESCNHALARLAEQTRIMHDTFQETGEVLFWLYAISNYGRVKPTISPGLHWARNRYAHGQLFTEPHKMSGDHYDTDFVWDRSSYAAPHWKHVLEIHFDNVSARPDQTGFQAFQDDLAGRPVLATLQAEADRLLAEAVRRFTPRSDWRKTT